MDDDDAAGLAVAAWQAAGGGRGGPTDVPQVLVAPAPVAPLYNYGSEPHEWEGADQNAQVEMAAREYAGPLPRPTADAGHGAAASPLPWSRTPEGSPAERHRGAPEGGAGALSPPLSMSPLGIGIGGPARGPEGGAPAIGYEPRRLRRRLQLAGPSLPTDASIASDGTVLEPQSGNFDAIVSPGESLQHAHDRVRVGGTILLLPGMHWGPLAITREVRTGRGPRLSIDQSCMYGSNLKQIHTRMYTYCSKYRIEDVHLSTSRALPCMRSGHRDICLRLYI